VVWRNFSDGEICYAYWDRVGSPTQNVIPDSSSGIRPDICIADGKVWIAWAQSGTIYSTSFDIGQVPPSTSNLVSASAPYTSTQPTLVCDGDSVVVFWVDDRINPSRFDVSGYILNGGPISITLSEIAGPVALNALYDFSVTVDTDSTYHVVWANSQGTGLWHKYAPTT
jgi:hypothetical protein